MRELLAELTAALARRRPCVYCAVVETRGSTPQKAGAAMLVYPDGTEAVVIGDAAGLPAGDRYLFDATGAPAAHLADRPAWDAVAAGLAALAQRPRPATRRGVAYLASPPRVTVFLVGGGHVGQAV